MISKKQKGFQEMTSRDLSGTSAGPLPAPVHDLSGTSAIPRSWWTPPASYVVLKYCHCQNRSNLELTFHQKKRQSQEKTTSGTAALGDDLSPVATHASLKQCFDKNPLSASTCTSMESKVTRHSYLHLVLALHTAIARKKAE